MGMDVGGVRVQDTAPKPCFSNLPGFCHRTFAQMFGVTLCCYLYFDELPNKSAAKHGRQKTDTSTCFAYPESGKAVAFPCLFVALAAVRESNSAWQRGSTSKAARMRYVRVSFLRPFCIPSKGAHLASKMVPRWCSSLFLRAPTAPHFLTAGPPYRRHRAEDALCHAPTLRRIPQEQRRAEGDPAGSHSLHMAHFIRDIVLCLGFVPLHPLGNCAICFHSLFLIFNAAFASCLSVLSWVPLSRLQTFAAQLSPR